MATQSRSHVRARIGVEVVFFPEFAQLSTIPCLPSPMLSLSLSSLFLFPFLPEGKKGRPTPLTWIDPFEHNISKGITLRVSFQLLEDSVSPFQKSLIALRYGLVSRRVLPERDSEM